MELVHLPADLMWMRRLVRRQEGMTLIEMLSAMAVFSIVLGMFALVLSSAIRHSHEVEEQTNLQVEARSAIAFVSSDLRQAYDGDADVATSPIESISPTQVTFLSPDRAQPFHLRRVSYRLSSGQFQRVVAASTDTDGPPWSIPPLGSYRKVLGSVVNGTVFTYKKADGTTATTAADVKTIDLTLTVATGTSPTRQYTYKTSVTVRGES
jgi:prepilin-type N-terminal cleavage/methylation domain-containing protein